MKKVILVGSGHAHLEILKALTKAQTASNQFVLISPERETYYSGLVPSLVMGKISVPHLSTPGLGRLVVSRQLGAQFKKLD